MSDTETIQTTTRHVIQPDEYMTSYQVGALIQANPSSINKWAKDGKISVHRTPGGHRRFQAADVVSFLIRHKMPIPTSLASVVSFLEHNSCG